MFACLAYGYMLFSAFFIFAFVIILDAKGYRRLQVGMATCYTVALVLKPARMVVNHYCVLALVKQGRATQRKGLQRSWPEIRAARMLGRSPGIADFAHEAKWMGNTKGVKIHDSEASPASLRDFAHVSEFKWYTKEQND